MGLSHVGSDGVSNFGCLLGVRRLAAALASITQLTPKALANFSPRVGAKRQPWDCNVNNFIKPCKGSAIGERFQRFAPIFNWDPKVVASLQPLG